MERSPGTDSPGFEREETPRCRSTFAIRKPRTRSSKIPEWYISGLMMDRALDAVVRRAKTVDRKHDIPYLAGYSQNGKIIYIDRHMPQTMTIRRPRYRYRPLPHPA